MLNESAGYEVEYLSDSFECDTFETVPESVDINFPIPSEINISQDQAEQQIYKKKKKTIKKTLRSQFTLEERNEFDELLLNLVFERPPLYDYCLPIEQRSQYIINNLWMEIANELKTKYGEIPITELKLGFKYHRDLYTRYKSSVTKQPSGSCAQPKLNVPKHLEILRQLDGVMAKRSQISNIEWKEPSISPMPSSSPDRCTLNKRKRSNSSISGGSTQNVDVGSSIDKLVEAVQLSATRPSSMDKLVDAVQMSATKPERRQEDRAQLFADQVACYMRTLTDVKFYEATTYINKYFYEQSLEKEK